MGWPSAICLRKARGDSGQKEAPPDDIQKGFESMKCLRQSEPFSTLLVLSLASMAVWSSAALASAPVIRRVVRAQSEPSRSGGTETDAADLKGSTNVRAVNLGPWIIGHRGSSIKAPENTLASFKLAAEEGADLIELDVHACKDGQIVVIHDDTVDRTSDGRGPIAGMTLAQALKLDFSKGADPKYRGERIPTLVQVCRWAKSVRKGLLVEIKVSSKKNSSFAANVVQTLEAEGMLGQSIVQSFDKGSLAQARSSNPDVRLGLLSSKPVQDTFNLQVWQFGLGYSSLKAADVDLLHNLGRRVFVWTVDKTVDMQAMIRMSTDGIITDRPDRLRDLIAKLGYSRRPWPPSGQ